MTKTTTRRLTVLTLTAATLLLAGGVAEAGSPQDLLQRARKIQSHFGGGSVRLPQPPSYGYPSPVRPPVCPPRPPVCREYCVYYLNCHHQWKLYGCYHSHGSAQAAMRHLQQQGYRTYLRVR